MRRNNRKKSRGAAIDLERREMPSTPGLSTSFDDPDDHPVTVAVARIVVAPPRGNPGLR